MTRSIEGYLPHFAFPDADVPVRDGEILADRSVALSRPDQVAEQGISREPSTTPPAEIPHSVTQWSTRRIGSKGCGNFETKIGYRHRERLRKYLPAICLRRVVVVMLLAAMMTVYLVSIFEFLEPAF